MTKRRETWAVTKPVFMLLEPKSRPPRSQSTRSSEEAANHGGAKGCREVETPVTKPMEDKPEAVLERDIRAGELLARWVWVEPTVWTLRMLTALEQGVEGGKWFSLRRADCLPIASSAARQKDGHTHNLQHVCTNDNYRLGYNRR